MSYPVSEAVVHSDHYSGRAQVACQQLHEILGAEAAHGSKGQAPLSGDHPATIRRPRLEHCLAINRCHKRKSLRPPCEMCHESVMHTSRLTSNHVVNVCPIHIDPIGPLSINILSIRFLYTMH